MDGNITYANRSRLVVLIPGMLASSALLAEQIHRLAVSEGRDVLYLTLVEKEDQALSITREMVALKAMTGGKQVNVESQQVPAQSWVESLRQAVRPGDQVVCSAEQVIPAGFHKNTTIHDLLGEGVDAPVMVLSGFKQPQQAQHAAWWWGLLAWGGFLAIAAIFALVEIRMEPVNPPTAQKLLMALLFLFEIGALWAWNSFTNR